MVAASVRLLPASRVLGLLFGLAAIAAPGDAIARPRARLVHCGEATCLRITGHRSHSAVAVRVAGQDLAVEGNRSWRATLPLAAARDWARANGSTLTLTLADTRTGTENMLAVTLPPGALGKRVALATLVVSAH